MKDLKVCHLNVYNIANTLFSKPVEIALFFKCTTFSLQTQIYGVLINAIIITLTAYITLLFSRISMAESLFNVY